MVDGLYAQIVSNTIKGTVISSEDQRPVFGANVLLEGTVLGAMTDSRGHFALQNIPNGEHDLIISMIGFKRQFVPDVLARTDRENLTVVLEPAAVQTEPVVITASKHEQSLEEVPLSMSIIDNQALTYRNTVTVDDALKYVPGVSITRGQVNIRGSTGFSYGVGTRVLILIDGLPFISGDTGEIIWESIPPDRIERIEIVKGAGSALYGSSALGGVINIITKRPSDQPETIVRTYGGLYQLPKYSSWQWTSDARTLGGLSFTHSQRFDQFSFSVGGSRTLDDGYKENDFWKRWNGWARIGYDISPFQSLAVSFSILDQHRGNFLYWKDLDQALQPQDADLNDRIQSTRWNLGVSHKYFFASTLYVTTGISWFHSHWDDNLPTPADSSGSSSISDFLVGEIQLNMNIAGGNFLTGGISGTLNNVSAETIFGDHTGHGGAVYLQDEISLSEELRSTIGGRYDFQTISGLESAHQFNPKIGVTYQPEPGISFRASVGSGFRTPSIAEIYTTTEAGGIIISPNPALQPERSWSYELGGSSVINENLMLDIALFRNELWDMIEPAFGTNGTVQFQNVTRASIIGTEISATLNIQHQWITDVGYTYVYPKNVETGEILKYRPRNLLYLSSKILFNPFQVGIDYRYLSRVEEIDEEFVQFGIVPDGDQRVPISVVDLRASVNWNLFTTQMTSSLQVNNLFQYYYSDFIGNLGPVRNFVVTMEAKI